MPDAKRAGAWPASVVLPPVRWKPAGFANETPTWLRNDLWPDESNRCLKPYVSTIDQMVARMARDEYSNFRQRIVLGIDPADINERSKPVGLTKVHTYESPRGHNRKLTIDKSAFEAGDVYITARRGDEAEGAWVDASDTVPLALNILGYDRPEAGAAVQAVIGRSSYGYSADYLLGGSSRDDLFAQAVANLLAIDAYDQRLAKREAEKEAKAKAEAEAAAKARRDAEYARHKQESYDRAKVTYADAIRDQIATGITAESVAKVQAALSAFETARRKLEGLPN